MSNNCTDCYQATPNYFGIPTFLSSGGCTDCEQGCHSVANFCYKGPNLTCSGVNSGDSLETVLQKFDTKLCATAGNFGTYQYNNLESITGNTITSQADFILAITNYVEAVDDDVTTFISTTFPAYQTSVTAAINTAANPPITCTSAGVTTADSLAIILAKYCTKFASLTTAIAINTVDWDQCFVVSNPPTTIAGGFDLLIDQICSIKAIADANATLPLFNNLGSCLATPGSADTLVQTIEKIKTRLCLTDPFDTADIAWGCITAQPDLQTTVEEIIETVSLNQQEAISEVSADFVLEATDPLNICSGKRLKLATPLVNSDRFVAVSNFDTDASTLDNKIIEGPGIEIDITTTPGKMILSTKQDNLVIAGPNDHTPKVLVDKLTGDTHSGITLTPVLNGLGDKVVLDLTVDMSILANTILTTVQSNPTLLNLFCSMVMECVNGNCGSLSYTITNNTLSTQPLTYLECGNSNPVSSSLTAGSTIVVCAIPGSVSAGSSTVAQGGACTGLPPATTTNTTTGIPTNSTTVAPTTTAAPTTTIAPCNCPVGYTYNGIDCTKTETTAAAVTYSGYCLAPSKLIEYSEYFTRIYNVGFANSSVNTFNPPPAEVYGQMTLNNQWKSTSNTTGPMNRAGVWIDSDCNGVKNGLQANVKTTVAFRYNNTGNQRVVYVGFGADNQFQIIVNNNTVASSTSSTSQNNFKIWHVIPVTLIPGQNYFNIVGTGDGSTNDSVGMTIYDNTAAQIAAATDDTQLNILFTSSNLIGLPYDVATCPAGWTLDSSGGSGSYVCKRILNTPCGSTATTTAAPTTTVAPTTIAPEV